MIQIKSKSNSSSKKLSHKWFADDSVVLAKKLLGKTIRKGSCEGIIVETEAYGTDPASHAHHITPRSKPMRDTYGAWYVYFTYGMYHCVNVTTNKDGIGAVLIRAVEPVRNIKLMQKRRSSKTGKQNIPVRNLCSGPAKLCQSFGITTRENVTPIGGDFAIYDAPDLPEKAIVSSTRIGIKNGTELPWRFFIKDNPFVSRK
ncbi:DNA-3-methyladenine glycosylase II [hydrothermal vent metagenome]|uniref:DNA-3-methyladenine glycosylase II n=1 Tax=hydrothermal vent metagenome TaxID=652676 RepID=A0A3B0UMX6_9ZZZZ